MSEEDNDNQDDRMERADRIRSRREGRTSRTSRSSDSDSESSQATQTAQSDQTEQNSRSEQPEQQSVTSQTSQPSQRQMSSQSTQQHQNKEQRPVKKRPHRTIYFPEDLNDELEIVIDTILYKAKTEAGVQLGKNRHVYPLVMYVGINQAQEMDIEELLDVLNEVESLDDPPDY